MAFTAGFLGVKAQTHQDRGGTGPTLVLLTGGPGRPGNPSSPSRPGTPSSPFSPGTPGTPGCPLSPGKGCAV